MYETLFVSVFGNNCNFDLLKDVAYLVKDNQKNVFVHSSSCDQPASVNISLVIGSCSVVGFVIVALVIVSILIKNEEEAQEMKEPRENNKRKSSIHYYYADAPYTDNYYELIK